MENTFEQLMLIIERNAENDKVEITNVKVFLERWRTEFAVTIENLIEESNLEEYSVEMRLSSIRGTLERWIKEMEQKDLQQLFIDIKSESVEIISKTQVSMAFLYYSKHKDYVDDMVKLTKNKFDPSQMDNKNEPMLWKAECWKWFLANFN